MSGTHKTISNLYTQLKCVAHIPLTVYFFIKNQNSLSNDKLEQYKKRLENPELLVEINSEYYSSAENIVTKSCSKLTNFCQSLKEDLSTLLDGAAMDQLNIMDTIVKNWIRSYNIDIKESPPKRARAFFVVEDIFNPTAAIKVFSTWFYDEQLGDAFLNDPTHMHRDLLVSDRVRGHITHLNSSTHN
ncbi:hypothetical protein I4U23_012331 [Adineta vaga]|nr:hypothetical protein I4U23_012331 [Adineta vaga]